MAKWKELPDLIPRAEAHAMVAAALTEAADLMGNLSSETDPAVLQASIDDFEGKDGHSNHARQYRASLILALIDAPADRALQRMLREAEAKGMEEALEDVHEADSLELAQHGQSKIVERILARAAEVSEKNNE